MKSFKNHILALAFLLLASSALSAADLMLVEKGVPRAEIVVAEKRSRMTTLAALGDDYAALWPVREGARPGFWNQDADGSFQAVYGLLRHLGIRWFMPGPMGEIMPKKETIALAALNETVKPDYAVRAWSWYNYGGFSFDDVIWARRIGMNSGYGRLGPLFGPHGLVHVHGHNAMQAAHPEYYALLGGKRDTSHREHGAGWNVPARFGKLVME